MQSLTIINFPLQRGDMLPAVTLAYLTRGELDPDGHNAALITHGYASGPRMIEPDASGGEGSWNELLGPGNAIDTDRYFVICPSMLGSSSEHIVRQHREQGYSASDLHVST